MTDTVFIYQLVDPRNNRPFYVGLTKKPNGGVQVYEWANTYKSEL